MMLQYLLTSAGLPVAGQAVRGELPVVHIAWTKAE